MGSDVRGVCQAHGCTSFLDMEGLDYYCMYMYMCAHVRLRSDTCQGHDLGLGVDTRKTNPLGTWGVSVNVSCLCVMCTGIW